MEKSRTVPDSMEYIELYNPFKFSASTKRGPSIDLWFDLVEKGRSVRFHAQKTNGLTDYRLGAAISVSS